MANLIPNLLPESSKAPRGERELFEVFRKAEGADGWTVLHSYRLARHKSKVEGEIDFVLVIPQSGIVCIEVKSHERVTRKNGQWLNSRGLPMQDPFSQVSEAMYSLKANLVKSLIGLKRFLFYPSFGSRGVTLKLVFRTQANGRITNF
ncbi:nuclease-related domain-containing protein [Corynebacterium tuberculostearicum]|uniref:nuclease-related domain-containing protein n=1 Tax=Corynebacterium tuberculostearicum TaxID=38304 RepID=UPI0038CFA538